MPAFRATLFACLGALAFLAAPAQATPGDLDLTFGGGDGIVQQRVGDGHAYALELAQTASGALVLAGQAREDSERLRTALAFFDVNGVYERSTLLPPLDGETRPLSLGVAADGAVWTTGTIGTNPLHTLMSRHLPSGELDEGFDGDALLADPADGSAGTAVAVLPDGDSLVAVQTGDATTPFVVLRVTPTGELDPDFGPEGEPFAALPHYAREIELRPGGGFFVWTDDASKGEPSVWTVTAYTEDGEPDTTFGDGGMAEVTLPGARSLRDVVVLPDGRPLLVGVREDADPMEAVVVRLTTAGAPDGTFGTSGMQSSPVFGHHTEIRDAALDAQGKLVAAGTTSLVDGDGVARGRFAVLRLRADGTLDPTFSGDGQATQQVGETSGGERVAIQPSGRIVVSGLSTDGTFGVFTLVGFEGGTPVVVVPPGDDDDDDGDDGNANGDGNGNGTGNDQGNANTATNTTTNTGTGTGTTGAGNTLTNPTARVTVRLLRGVRRGALRASLRWPASLSGKVVLVRVRTTSGRLVGQRRIRLDRDGRATVRIPLTRAGRALHRRGKLRRVRVSAAVVG